jgi:hypothetical protein
MQVNSFPPLHALALSFWLLPPPVILHELALLPAPTLLLHEQLGLQASQYWVVFAVCEPGDFG